MGVLLKTGNRTGPQMCPHLHVNEWHAFDTAWMNMRGDWQWLWCKYIHTKTFKSHFPSISGVRLARTAKPAWLTFTEATLHSLVHQLTPSSIVYLLGPCHTSPPVLSPDARHSATLGVASLAIIYFASLRVSLSQGYFGVGWAAWPYWRARAVMPTLSVSLLTILPSHPPIPPSSTELSVWLWGKVYTNHWLMMERPVNKNKINPNQKAISGRPCYI